MLSRISYVGYERLVRTPPIENCKKKELKKKTKKILKNNFHPLISKIFTEKLGFECFTPIQLVSSVVLCEPSNYDLFSPTSSDIILAAPTGQGKTLAYVLPILSNIFYEHCTQLRCIILAPTRELVHQIFQVFQQCKHNDYSPSSHVLPLLPRFGHSSLQTLLQQQQQQVHYDFSSKSTSSWLLQRKSLLLDTLLPSQQQSLSHSVIIGTPTRFLDYIALIQTYYDDVMCSHYWASLQWIVLDEVDRMLEQNFEPWIQELDQISQKALTRPRKILASATMTENPEKLELLHLCRPLYFVTSNIEGSYTVPPQLTQRSVIIPHIARSLEKKVVRPIILLYLIHQLYSIPEITSKNKKRHRHEVDPTDCDEKQNCENANKPVKTAIFCNSRQTAAKIALFLKYHFGSSQEKLEFAVNDQERRYPESIKPIIIPSNQSTGNTTMTDDEIEKKEEEVTELRHTPVKVNIEHFSANLSQKERARLVSRFGSNQIDIIVCSDVLARGLDLPYLDVVINYELPLNRRIYIHRVGRTARAGRPGYCYTLVTPDEVPLFKTLLDGNVIMTSNKTFTSLWSLMQQHSLDKHLLKQWAFLKSQKHHDDDGDMTLGHSTQLHPYFKKLYTLSNLD